MIPKEMPPAEAKAKHAKVVAEVKTEFGQKPAHTFTGAQVAHEIAKRWAEVCGVKFDAPPPAPPSGAPVQTLGPAPAVQQLAPIKMPTEPGIAPIQTGAEPGGKRPRRKDKPHDY